MIDVKKAITTLARNEVDFVIIGGVALSIHSAAYVTYDIDVCFSRNRNNLRKIADALAPFHPRLRGFPKNLPFVWDFSTLLNGTLFTLETELGDFDLLGEVSGLGTYEDVLAQSSPWDLYGYKVNILSINGLIQAKESAGREKDVPGLKILRALLDAEIDED
ncbi:MAG: hypothetical protein H0X08_00760 [Blastocatellia bacterium]|nr:hypothetical protein [Blastocatellia bacterium]